MDFIQRVEGKCQGDGISWSLITPKGAMRLIAMDFGYAIFGDLSCHIPCFVHDCDNSDHIDCDLFGGEANCHVGVRNIGEMSSLDDNKIFEYLEKMYEQDVACYTSTERR